MKKLTILVLLSATALIHQAFACTFTFNQLGNTVMFSYSNAFSPFFTIDSVEIDFGDGNTFTQVNNPPSSAFTFSYPHLYQASGIYNACIQEYTSWGSAPQPPCTHCETITVGTVNNCFANAAFNSLISGLNVSFDNVSTCASCTSASFIWDFGDASPVSTLFSPPHTYAAPGNYTVCLVMTAVDTASVVCSDTFCYTINVNLAPGQCLSTSLYSVTLLGATAYFTDLSTCNGCTGLSYLWNFGDGATSVQQNPSHTYPANGTYNSCLIITGISSSSTTCIDTNCISLPVTTVGLCEWSPQSLSVFPNPATNIVNVLIPENAIATEIRILDVTGRILFLKTIEANSGATLLLDITPFSKGIYLLQLTTEDGIYQSQLIKE